MIYCSGEDPEFPVTELLDPSVNSRGWQSAPFCAYPQEIIVQFPSVVSLRQLQFLSHQAKISQKIELFTFNPNTAPQQSQQIPLNEIQFKKLGYLTLDSNERSDFQARELKSVHIDVQTALLKLIFHKCHVNAHNDKFQIGLVALNCIGPADPHAPTPQPRSLQQTPTAQTPQAQRWPPGTDPSQTKYSQQMDPETASKLQNLES